jgi:hypothetical protein
MNDVFHKLEFDRITNSLLMRGRSIELVADVIGRSPRTVRKYLSYAPSGMIPATASVASAAQRSASAFAGL